MGGGGGGWGQGVGRPQAGSGQGARMPSPRVAARAMAPAALLRPHPCAPCHPPPPPPLGRAQSTPAATSAPPAPPWASCSSTLAARRTSPSPSPRMARPRWGLQRGVGGEGTLLCTVHCTATPSAASAHRSTPPGALPPRQPPLPLCHSLSRTRQPHPTPTLTGRRPHLQEAVRGGVRGGRQPRLRGRPLQHVLLRRPGPRHCCG
jgi:hypothetical protein